MEFSKAISFILVTHYIFLVQDGKFCGEEMSVCKVMCGKIVRYEKLLSDFCSFIIFLLLNLLYSSKFYITLDFQLIILYFKVT